MGILDGAATDLQAKLERVGVRENLAYALGQLAYARGNDIAAWVAPPVISKAEIAWLASEYVKQLRDIYEELPRITMIQGLCTKVFGPYGEMMFVGSYPEFSEDQWEATLARMLGTPSDPPSPAMAAAAMAGWYADPYGAPALRWWTGQSWTESLTPQTGSNTSSYPHPIQAPRTQNTMAVTGFGFGVASVFLFAIPFFGLLITLTAAALSLFGLGVQTPQHSKSGKVLAIIGLCLGLVYMLMYFANWAMGRL